MLQLQCYPKPSCSRLLRFLRMFSPTALPNSTCFSFCRVALESVRNLKIWTRSLRGSFVSIWGTFGSASNSALKLLHQLSVEINPLLVSSSFQFISIPNRRSRYLLLPSRPCKSQHPYLQDCF